MVVLVDGGVNGGVDGGIDWGVAAAALVVLVDGGIDWGVAWGVAAAAAAAALVAPTAVAAVDSFVGGVAVVFECCRIVVEVVVWTTAISVPVVVVVSLLLPES